MTDFAASLSLVPLGLVFVLFGALLVLLAALVLAPLWAPIAAAISSLWDKWRHRDDIDTMPR